ncbi:unnamed protein product, partial [Mesorhabditis spiculigera]
MSEYPARQHAPRPVARGPMVFGELSQEITCAHCGKTGFTRVEREAGTCAWVSGCLMFWTAAFCLCSCLPCCMDAFLDAHHHCSKCGQLAGVYKKM